MGVEVHYFTGNHDIWTYGYLEEECGLIVHTKPETVEIYDKVFYIAHGDGLGDPDRRFKFIKSVFHNRTCQVLFNSLHPRWAMWYGLTWAKHSRLKRADGKEPPYMGEDREHLVLFAKQYMKTHNDVDYFMFGHRHDAKVFGIAPTQRIAKHDHRKKPGILQMVHPMVRQQRNITVAR